MPTDTLMIERVETLPRKGGERFLVYPIRPAGSQGWSPWYETLDQWKAATAQRAKDLNQPVTLRWHDDPRYGYQIDSIALAERMPLDVSCD